MQSVISLPNDAIKKCRQYYQNSLVSPTPAGGIFRAAVNGVTITAYRSGKVMFQGQEAETEAARWQALAQGPTTPTTTNQSKLASKSPSTKAAKAGKAKPGENLPAGFANWSVIGSDEVGAGAYFGPLTTAAVYVPKEELAWVKSLGIADSKTLTDEKMLKIAPQIIDRLPHHVVNLMPEKYNELQEKGENIVAMKALSHNFVLQTVLEKIQPTQPDGFLIDQFVAPSSYFRYLKKNRQSKIVEQNVYFTTKGESFHLAVAAASILARYVELQSMEHLSQEAGMTLPIGAGKETDRVAAKLIKEKANLRHFAKLHFANTQKAEKLAKL
ncbi:ribonuclease HIII [Fructobacillus pseudoficulneus]|uniref:Ribonuclease HIII n=1 Tax=Fructobacillus pseudoficulneus TaxID=220714 RepID=A0A3F3H4U1_9LACO|nr:ribonuclease HIII [Fructobacillus pseudoficulneus]GAP03000.1 ribonuclease HIII [Fructobacillus pseudoficulneus]SEH44594.1 ribonuclease HIII [Fructobacillus pseudoficulneus]